jgi:hypothetical protein
MQKEDPNGKRIILEKWVQVSPHDPVILSNLSAAYVKMGNKEKAAEYLKLLKRFDK